MLVMDKVLSLVDKNSRDRRLTPVFLGVVNDNVSGDIIMCVSLSHIEFFDLKNAELEDSFSHFEIVKINYSEGKSMNIHFNNGYVFKLESSEIGTIFEKISEILQKLLKVSEQSKIGLTDFIKKKYQPTPTSVLLRLREKAICEDGKFPSAVSNTFQTLMMLGSNEISLGNFENPSRALPYFLDIVPMFENFDTVTIPRISGIDPYDEAISLMRQPSNIKFLELEGPVTPAFNKLMKVIKENNKVHLEGFSFTNSKLSIEHLKTIEDVMVSRNIYNLSMHRAVDINSQNYFYTTFLKKRVGDNLVVLNLDRTSNVNISLLVTCIQNISMLSLAYCDIQIMKFLTLISKFKFNNLLALNLSGNPCPEVKEINSYKFPSNIAVLMVNNIEWRDGCLSSFLVMLSLYFRNNLNLSISKSSASEYEWNGVFSHIFNIKFENLKSLVWDSNPLSKTFFEFLRNHDSIKYLSLNGCFSESKSEHVMSLFNFISTSRNLESLSVRGARSMFMGKYTRILLSYVLKSQLNFLDFSYNYCGDTCIAAIKELFKKNISVVVLDGMMPEYPETLIQILDASKNSQTNLSFPWEDLNYLYTRKKVDRVAYNDIIDNYKVKRNGGILEDDFYLYFENQKPNFPKFLTLVKNDELTPGDAREKNNSYAQIQPDVVFGDKADTSYNSDKRFENYKIENVDVSSPPKRLFEISNPSGGEDGRNTVPKKPVVIIGQENYKSEKENPGAIKLHRQSDGQVLSSVAAKDRRPSMSACFRDLRNSQRRQSESFITREVSNPSFFIGKGSNDKLSNFAIQGDRSPSQNLVDVQNDSLNDFSDGASLMNIISSCSGIDLSFRSIPPKKQRKRSYSPPKKSKHFFGKPKASYWESSMIYIKAEESSDGSSLSTLYSQAKHNATNQLEPVKPKRDLQPTVFEKFIKNGDNDPFKMLDFIDWNFHIDHENDEYSSSAFVWEEAECMYSLDCLLEQVKQRDVY